MPEDDRSPLLPVSSPRVECALKAIMRDVGLSEEQISARFPDHSQVVGAVVTLDPDGRLVVSSPSGRLTSPHDIMSAYARGEIAGLDAARRLHLDSLDALHDAMRDVGQHAMPPFAEETRHPVEDGPGSGRRVELTVRVLVGTERSTVIVDDPVTGRALAHQVVPHGAEAGAAAAAVASLVGDKIAGDRRDD